MIDGLFAVIAFGVTASYVTPFALHLGASELAIGLLGGLPAIAAASVMLLTDRICRLIDSRLKLISRAISFHAVSIICVPFVFLMPQPAQVPGFILLTMAGTLFNALAHPAWSSLMSDTVEKWNYGKYFAWRNRILGFLNMLASAGAGVYLHYCPDEKTGFILLFLLAGVCRSVSAYYLGKMDDIRVSVAKRHQFSYLSFVRALPRSNYARFVFYISFLNLATFIAVPFFAVYMLQHLGFGYLQYAVITATGSLVGLLSLPFWGKLADHHGTAVIIKSTAWIIPIVPCLWVFGSHPVYIASLFGLGSYAWSGLLLACTNYTFDAVRPEKRTRCVAYFSFTNSLFVALGSVLGGYLATQLPPLIKGSSLLVLFCLSGGLRAVVNLVLMRSWHEVRPAADISKRRMVSLIIGINPLLSLRPQAFYRLRRIKRIRKSRQGQR